MNILEITMHPLFSVTHNLVGGSIVERGSRPPGVVRFRDNGSRLTEWRLKSEVLFRACDGNSGLTITWCDQRPVISNCHNKTDFLGDRWDY